MKNITITNICRQTLFFLSLSVIMISCGSNDDPISTDPDPQIDSIQPTSGPVGTSVTITGSGFSPTVSVNTVRFAETSADVSSASESQLTATVPSSAESGRVVVSVNGATASGPEFTVEDQAPGINSVEPESGTVGTEVTINGINFSSIASENSVTFNGVEATIQSATVDELITEIPMGATDGPIEVTVKQKSVTGPNFDVITEGVLKVSTNTSGTMLDSDGYRLRINQNWEYSINANDERIFSSFSQDQYSLKISDVANNCFVENENPRSFSIIAGDTTSVALEINCKKALKDKIVFASNPDLQNADRDIYVINPDGSNQEKLFDTPEIEDFPEISNSGIKVVFRQTNSSDNNLYIADVDGSGLQQITNLPNFAFTASWSPDDSRIIFSNGTEEDAEIFVVNSDGTNLTQLTDDTAWNRYPEWSPDGSKIVFDSNIDGDFEIYTMNPDGSNVEKLTNDSYRNSTAKWSPDGSELIFESTRDGNLGDIYRMNADGTNVRRITTNNGGASAPDWSPDGSRIVFEDNRDLFIINSDGSGSSSQITNNPNPNLNQIGIADWSTN